MKNTCVTLLVLTALASNAMDDGDLSPHKMFYNVHPAVFKTYMESLADSVPEMEDMLTLFNMYWDYVKTGKCEYKRLTYCYYLNEAHDVLMDLYFSDREKIKTAEPFLVEKQNEMFPSKTIYELQWAENAIFQVQSTDPPKNPKDISTEPYDTVKDVDPVALLEYMESQPDMEELLTLYKFYWKYKGSGRCDDGELARFCGLLLDGFKILFNMYFSGPENNIRAAMPSIMEIQNRLNHDS